MTGKLTIVLPLKGRPEFTQRFLKHACRGPHEILVADGSLSPQRHLVEAYGAQYHYHEPDHTLADYWAKMVWALDLVQTPYAMVADNDDFPLHRALDLCVSFLEGQQDFVGCAGRIHGLWLWPHKVDGPYCRITRQYAPYDTPATFDQDSPSDRVLAGFTNSWSYYAVYRTEVLRQIWRSVLALKLKDFQVHEKFCAMQALLQGKLICFNDVPSYLRQYETSTRDTDIVKDWSLRLKNNEWGNDITKVLAVMKAEGVDTVTLRRAWADWYARHLDYHFGWHGQLRRGAKALLPKLAYAYQHRHEYHPFPPKFAAVLR